MNSLAEIWEELFNAEPTLAEEELMGNLASVVDPQDTSFIICALVVRFLNQSLLLDPKSPIAVASQLNETLSKMERRSAALDRQYYDLKASASHLAQQLFGLREIVARAESIIEKRKIPAPVLQLDPDRGSPYWEHTLAPNALWSFGLLALAGGIVGTMAGIGLTIILV